jgi:hypothetical protein
MQRGKPPLPLTDPDLVPASKRPTSRAFLNLHAEKVRTLTSLFPFCQRRRNFDTVSAVWAPVVVATLSLLEVGVVWLDVVVNVTWSGSFVTGIRSLQGLGTVEACRRVGITGKTGYRWRAEMGGVRT